MTPTPVDRGRSGCGVGVEMRTSGTAEGQEPRIAKEIGKSGGLRERQWANPLEPVYPPTSP
jgi:hypothetical protein